METILPEHPPFSQAARSTLDDLVNRVTVLYTRCITQGDRTAAEKALSLHQREHVAWERDTVWRTMLNHARGATEESVVVEGTPRVVNAEEEKGLVNVPTPLGRLKVTKQQVSFLIAVVVGIVLLNVSVVEGIEASRCLAVLVFCTILWATEVSTLTLRLFLSLITSFRRYLYS
jgi:phosphate transporter